MRPRGRAIVDRSAPSTFGICDRCGFLYNLNRLNDQYEWAGVMLDSSGWLVCDSCMDTPQEQLRAIGLPPDPRPIHDPRPERYDIDMYGYLVTQDDEDLVTQDDENLITQESPDDA